jgi:CheY-like chemotaxis protein
MPDRERDTRHLNIENDESAVPQHGTGPLDYLVPWVIELRIIGTTQVIQIQVKEQMTLGRGDGRRAGQGPDVDFDPYNGHYLGVSRVHAVLTARNSRVTIRDLGSSNGTYVNGGRLNPEQDFRLRHGDHLVLGRLEMQVSFVVMPSSHEKNETPYSDVTIPRMASGQRVLLLEDDERVAQTIAYVLEEAGFNVIVTRTVTDALTLVDGDMPDLIVMELMLPDRNGLELVHYVRECDEGHGLPVIVVSSVSGGYQMGQAIEAGVDVFLSKPVGVDELMRGLGKVLTQMGS